MSMTEKGQPFVPSVWVREAQKIIKDMIIHEFNEPQSIDSVVLQLHKNRNKTIKEIMSGSKDKAFDLLKKNLKKTFDTCDEEKDEKPENSS